LFSYQGTCPPKVACLLALWASRFVPLSRRLIYTIIRFRTCQQLFSTFFKKSFKVVNIMRTAVHMPPLEGISGAGCFQEIIDCLIECFRMPVCHKVVSFQDHHPGARDVFGYLPCVCLPDHIPRPADDERRRTDCRQVGRLDKRIIWYFRLKCPI
ncbi:MAG: hypothetical protein LKG80_05945, partial [Lachnospiraceae bacterium]|nr:hypothetical protein [Lachnospiraceae bacterium]